MVFKWAAKALNALSAKAILQRLDKRKLQHELDTHRLFLLTSYHQLGAAGGVQEDTAEQLAAEAEKLQFEGMRREVASNLSSQLLFLTAAVHSILGEHGDPAPAAARLSQVAAQLRAAAQQAQSQQAAQQEARARPAGRGLSFALGSDVTAAAAAAAAAEAASQGLAGPRTPTAAGVCEGPPAPAAGAVGAGAAGLSRQELAAAFRERCGFSLRVAPSSIAHRESGDGLWIDGKAGVGQVVAFYPGATYIPLQYRSIPGYPKIDRDNDYLIGRFDGVVLDAKPWGRGLESLGEGRAGKAATGGGLAAGLGWPAERRNVAEAALALLEGRHPLALAHFANHPSQGAAPNVMVAAFDFRAQDGAPHLRAYIPNTLLYDEAPGSVQQHTQHAQQQEQQQHETASGPQLGGAMLGVSPEETVAGLALVATREVEDEELFLNYRLSPHVPRPAWYQPWDEEEERRRWA